MILAASVVISAINNSGGLTINQPTDTT